jgi:hypothetical protein
MRDKACVEKRGFDYTSKNLKCWREIVWWESGNWIGDAALNKVLLFFSEKRSNESKISPWAEKGEKEDGIKKGEKCKLAGTISESRIPIGFRVVHFNRRKKGI